MSAQPIAGATPPPATGVTKLPELVIDGTRFEGNEVSGSLLTIAGTAKMVPIAGDPATTVLAMDDIVTVQIDLKVSGISYETDKNGILTRVQRARPIEGSAQVIDVLRKRDTRIR